MELCFNEMTVMKNGALPEDIGYFHAAFTAVPHVLGGLWV